MEKSVYVVTESMEFFDSVKKEVEILHPDSTYVQSVHIPKPENPIFNDIWGNAVIDTEVGALRDADIVVFDGDVSGKDALYILVGVALSCKTKNQVVFKGFPQNPFDYINRLPEDEATTSKYVSFTPKFDKFSQTSHLNSTDDFTPITQITSIDYTYLVFDLETAKVSDYILIGYNYDRRGTNIIFSPTESPIYEVLGTLIINQSNNGNS